MTRPALHFTLLFCLSGCLGLVGEPLARAPDAILFGFAKPRTECPLPP
jgi:hypothetical protein